MANIFGVDNYAPRQSGIEYEQSGKRHVQRLQDAFKARKLVDKSDVWKLVDLSHIRHGCGNQNV